MEEALSMQVLPFLSIFTFRKSGLRVPTMLLHDLLVSPQPREAEVAKCETWGLAWFPYATNPLDNPSTLSFNTLDNTFCLHHI